MLSKFKEEKIEFLFKYYAIFPVVVLIAFTLGRGLGNTLYYITLLSFLPFLVFFRSEWIELKELFYAYGFWVISLVFIFFINGSSDYKTVSIFILSSFFGLALSKIVYDNWDFFITWASRLVLCLMIYHILDIVHYYITDGASPAGDIQTWNFVVLSPLLFLTKNSRNIKLLYSLIIVAIVFLSASRTQMVAVLMALLIYVTFVNKKMAYLIFAAPVVLILAILLNQLFRSKIAFDSLEHFFSRITSRRSDIWLEAIEKNTSYLFGNGLGSSLDITAPYGIASMHNIFLELYWDLGLVSVFVFVLFMIYFLMKVKFVYDLDRTIEKKHFAIIFSIFFICFCMLVLDKSFTNFVPRFYFYFILGLIFVMSSCFGRTFRATDTEAE